MRAARFRVCYMSCHDFAIIFSFSFYYCLSVFGTAISGLGVVTTNGI